MKFARIYFMILLLIVPLFSMAQLTYPINDGDRVRYNLQIEVRKSCLSGICIMVNNNGLIASSIINEFGISLMDFTYLEHKDKVKIISLIKPLNRWYIKRLLKRSLKGMLKAMKVGNTEYFDKKNKIKYVFILNNEA